MAEGVFRLMYRSHSCIPETDRRTELGKLFSEARSNNKKLELSGALLLSAEWFVQVLEGDEETVRGLYTRIEKDPRHERVSLLESGDVDGRLFSRWAMARVSEEGEPDIPLLAGTRGVVTGARRVTTPEQDEILDRMRDATRTDSHVA